LREKKRDVFIFQRKSTPQKKNALDREVSFRKSSVPNKKLEDILNILKLKPQPFRKRKSVVHKTTVQILKPKYLLASLSG
jgi:predicted site-specific integrase-resolvase